MKNTLALITLFLIDSTDTQRVVDVTEEQKNKLVDDDVAWFDGTDWCVMDGEELQEIVKQNKLEIREYLSTPQKNDDDKIFIVTPTQKIHVEPIHYVGDTVRVEIPKTLISFDVNIKTLRTGKGNKVTQKLLTKIFE